MPASGQLLEVFVPFRKVQGSIVHAGLQSDQGDQIYNLVINEISAHLFLNRNITK